MTKETFNREEARNSRSPEAIGVAKRETLGDALAKLEAAVGSTHRSVTTLEGVTQSLRTVSPEDTKHLVTLGTEDVHTHLLSRINVITASVASASLRIDGITNEFDV